MKKSKDFTIDDQNDRDKILLNCGRGTIIKQNDRERETGRKVVYINQISQNEDQQPPVKGII